MAAILNNLKNHQINFLNRKNLGGKTMELDVGIFIVDAWGKNKYSWDFLNANKAFCDIFKINPD